MDDNDTQPLTRRQVGAMWTHGELMALAASDEIDALMDEAEAQLHEWTRRYTRFDPDSVLERLNDAGGGTVSDELADILSRALQAWHDTGGRFDIGLGSELIAEGYGCDFEDLPAPTEDELDPERRLELARAQRAAVEADVASAPRDARSEPPLTFTDERTIAIRAGSRLDLGGFVKGWAADRACELIARAGCSCLVNLGGDIAVHVEPGDPPWPVALHLPEGVASLAVPAGGVATSGQEVRLWHVDTEDGVGRLGHHIIDPRTGHSAASEVTRLTVVAATCADAEIWSKALMLVGGETARQEADDLGLQAVLVNLDDTVLVTSNLG